MVCVIVCDRVVQFMAEGIGMDRLLALNLPEGRFSDLYRRLAASRQRVHEPVLDIYALRERGLSEKMVQRLWFDQALADDSLRTEDERPLRVSCPGWWNVEAGPDFLNAEFQRGEESVERAHVEIHVLASGWSRHGHDRDPAYRGVGLHVCLVNDTGEACVVCDNGRRIPQLALNKHVAEEIQEIVDSGDEPARGVESDGAGVPPCRRAMIAGEVTPEWLGKFLDAAGDERLLRKSDRFERELAGRTLDQVVLEGLMEALGYKRNQVPFKRLARRLSVAELRRFLPDTDELQRKIVTAEAMFFAVAGLLEPCSNADEETREYCRALEHAWGLSARDLQGRMMRRADWHCAGTRPLNHPCRRLAAAAVLVARCLHVGLFRSLLTAIELCGREPQGRGCWREFVAAVRGMFTVPDTSYWARRCTFGGKPLAAKSELIGKDRGMAMMVNVVIPLLLRDARSRSDGALERTMHLLYSALPREARNQRTRYVATRIFGAKTKTATVVNSARRQQGLLQLHADCCNDASKTCAECVLLVTMGMQASWDPA